MKVNIEFDAEVPIGASEDQIVEWITYCLCGGGMSAENPLHYDLEADRNTLIIDLK